MPISNRLVYPRTHTFHIPVMGTGHSIDTPLRVARWGISSVISLVDDRMIEQVHRLHARRLGREFQPVDAKDPKARAERIRRYLDFMHQEVLSQMAQLRLQSFQAGTDKDKYFRMLPDSSPLKIRWKALGTLSGAQRQAEELALSEAMEPGSIDANIMTKLDRRPLGPDGVPVEARLSDAKLALEGFALSVNPGNMVLSAGINPTLYGCMEEFETFYRREGSEPEKGVIIKVSDFRSALTQGRFLAKKGLEVREFRIESGLNCGGHAFASEGELLGPIVDEFRKERHRLQEEFAGLMAGYYRKKGWEWPAGAQDHIAAITVQGGLGVEAEHRRMLEDFGLDATGWGAPFLLVPEATPIDTYTRERLAASVPGDIYLSDSSPLGVPFNNLRGSSAEIDLWRKFDEGRPGSGCPKGFLSFNTEFTEHPICTATRRYQAAKIAEVGGIHTEAARQVAVKECICHQLGNGALQVIREEMGESVEGAAKAPVSICPGPNIVWFTRDYSLEEMVDHIYGRIPSLVSDARPHAFAAELSLYMEHLEKLRAQTHPENPRDVEKLANFRANLAGSLSWYRSWLATRSSLPGENLRSLREEVERVELALLDVAETPALCD
ncbi:MAG TPA: hypothetical protein PKO15_00225 [Fibrobacteria bacterium]|nr:hypothetical protein [Fibrobacteria bacterium]